jgi:pimeloyl-ACP methyl ester carboxylesterase
MNAAIGALELRRLRAPIDGGDLALLRFGRAGAPPLLFAHANGFCASAYRQMFEALGDRHDVFGVDMRGYGRSGAPALPSRHKSADMFGDDLARLLDELGETVGKGAGWTLAGHSIGAVAATIAASKRDDVVSLRLIEPVATPRIVRLAARTPLWPFIAERWSLVAGARRRRASWPSRADVVASYRDKALFSTWAPGVLEDYLADGLRDGAGGVELSCSPAWEAATFMGQRHDFWRALACVKAPVRVLAARHPTSTSPAFAIRRLQKAGADVRIVEGATHLYPFENPLGAAQFLLAR